MKRILLLIVFIFSSCETIKKNKPLLKNPETKTITNIKQIDSFIKLNEKNAIPFLYEYSKKNLEDKVKISTEYGDIVILLYKNTNIHRSNFIFLIKKKYFDGTIFHRVVPDFIIQGGNSDDSKILLKRRQIGRYLLPPDTRKGNKHHRGVISMPSSEIDNPHKLASPFEFFIVQQNSGAYHLDKDYTAFGRVIKGMDVVDKINKEKTDDRETPHKNIYIKAIVVD
ncbi:MAG: peptidyl-prolyl cis-trans isomerase A (cyclophilin A) [Candidatus Marivariicella framensis]|jgi:peptidyl-prolyl cis-trans isomerase A (cyclophilin A)|tara:strand:+ start:2487 stop:3161 length:675 start_codon:yes stop_codon:yes gene_type:complete